MRSLQVACEAVMLLFYNFLHDLIVFGSEFVVVLLLEAGPDALVALTIFHEIVQFNRQFASVNEFSHLFLVLLLHVFSVCRVLSLQEDGKQLQHCLLNR